MSEKKIIMEHSDEAAQLKTVTGWVSSDGRFFGNDERTARYAGSTHRTCECGAVFERGRTICDKCSNQKRWEKYKTLEAKLWDGEAPLCTWDDDKFFWNDSDLADYCDEEHIQPQDLQLVFAVPVYGRYLDTDYFQDELAEDGELPDAITEAMDRFNEVVKAAGPLSWRDGKIAAIIPEHYRIDLDESSEEVNDAEV